MQGLGQEATPLLELDYWSARAADLSGLVMQLRGPGAAAVSAQLEAVSSTYSGALDRLLCCPSLRPRTA